MQDREDSWLHRGWILDIAIEEDELERFVNEFDVDVLDEIYRIGDLQELTRKM